MQVKVANSLRTSGTLSVNWAGPRRGRTLHASRYKISNLGAGERCGGISVFMYSS